LVGAPSPPCYNETWSHWDTLTEVHGTTSASTTSIGREPCYGLPLFRTELTELKPKKEE